MCVLWTDPYPRAHVPTPLLAGKLLEQIAELVLNNNVDMADRVGKTEVKMGCAPSATSFYAPPPKLSALQAQAGRTGSAANDGSNGDGSGDSSASGNSGSSKQRVLFLDVDGVLHQCSISPHNGRTRVIGHPFE